MPVTRGNLFSSSLKSRGKAVATRDFMKREIRAFPINNLSHGAGGLLAVKAELRIPRKRTGISEQPWQWGLRA